MLGLRDYKHYREGILSFYHIYSAFERSWAHLLANPAFVEPHVYTALQAIADPRLTRASAIASDLTYLYGPDEFNPTALAKTGSMRAEFVSHIEERLREKPHLVIAYAHNYYMALFAGGKMLLRQILMAKNFFPIKAPAGDYDEAKAFSVNMFIFPTDAGKEETLRIKFKEAMQIAEESLNEVEKTGLFLLPGLLGLTDNPEEIIEESRAIYQMNERLIRELDEICKSSTIPAAQLDQADPTHRFANHKLLLMMSFVATLWMIKWYLCA